MRCMTGPWLSLQLLVHAILAGVILLMLAP